MADKKFTLAHPLDEGNIFVKDGKPKQAGDVIPLNDNAARHLAAAGYLNLDADGNPAEANTSA